MAAWQDEVLDFWFNELKQEDRFGGASEVDQTIRDRFGTLYERLAKAVPPEAMSDARTALATIIVYDQFPRNMFRGKPKAFATDSMAVQVARIALEKGFETEVDPDHKTFFYMPFMHSEVLSDQERCVDLFKALGGEEGLRYAIEHRDIIARFGRFPHRNRALGRTPTGDEIEFMKTHDGNAQKSDDEEEKA